MLPLARDPMTSFPRSRLGCHSDAGGHETLHVRARDRESLEELRKAVMEWLHVYNHVRAHQALDWMTPAEKRAENLGVELKTAA